MKAKTIIDRLIVNWLPKSCCVVAATVFFLWHHFGLLETKNVPVNLHVISDGAYVCTSHIPHNVSVSLRTEASHMAEITADGIEATLDLSYISGEGSYTLPVMIDLPPSLQSIDPISFSVHPETITVRMEEKIRRSVPIAVYTAGEAVRGYQVLSVASEPSYVSVIGPRSVIDGIKQISTREVMITDKSSSFSEAVQLSNLTKLITLESDAPVTAFVEMGPVISTRTYYGREIQFKRLPPELEVAEVTEKVDFTISGPLLSLEAYEPGNGIIESNLGHITEPGTYEVPVTIALPAEFILESISVENIKIEVREKSAVEAENPEGKPEA